MAGKLIPLPELAPAVPRHATSEQCARLWFDLCEASEQLLLAGLRAEIGPGGDLQQAYRNWYRNRMEEHDQMIRDMLANLTARERGLGR
jgi:hypothetical protein